MPLPFHPDVILGLVAKLKSDTEVIALCGSNVFDFEFDTSVDLSMPEKVIVVKPHGGPKNPATLELNYSRVIIQCWGETPHLAYVVYWAAYAALKGLTPSVWANTYIHNCIETAGPTPARDVKTQWPYNNSIWLVKASDLVVA